MSASMVTNLYLSSCLLYAAGASLGVAALGLPEKLSARSGRFTKIFILLGWLAQTAYLVVDGIQKGRHPWSTPQEMLLFLMWTIVLIYLAVDLFYGVKAFASFLSPVVAVVSAAAALLAGGRYELPESGVMAKLHGMTALIGCASFVLAACSALMYLLQERELKSKQQGRMFKSLPSLGVLDKLNWVSVAVGLLFLTIAFLSGAAMAGAQKTADEIRSALPFLAFLGLAWTTFAAVLYARLSGKSRGRKIADLTLAGLFLLVIALVVLLVVPDAMHSLGQN